MKKYYISYVVEGFGYEGSVKIMECEGYLECLIGVIKHFTHDEIFDEDVDLGVEELEEMLNSIQSENCGEWMVVSIIEDGYGVRYIY